MHKLSKLLGGNVWRLLIIGLLLVPAVAGAATSPSASSWIMSSPFEVPRVVGGDGNLMPASHDELVKSKMSVFAGQECEDHDYFQDPSGVLVSGCWYETEIGELSRAGYSVKPSGKQAAPIDGWGSEYFPTKNPNIFIETPLHMDDGLMGLSFWQAKDMVFSGIWPYGLDGPMYYTMPDNGSHTIRNPDDSPYTFNNNLLHSNIWYSENAEWMLIRHDEGFVDLFSLKDFSWKRINTTHVGFGSFAISNDGRYIVEAVLSGQPRVIDTALCEGANCQSADLGQALSQIGVEGASVSVPKFYDNETIGVYAPMLDSNENVREWEYIIQAPNTYGRSYMALGDSFASGEGAFRYTAATSGGRNGNNCHVSRNSYAFLLSDRHDTSVRNVACSGAKTTHVAYTAQHPTDNTKVEEYVPGTHAQVAFAEQARPDVVTISIGGNDIGFTSKITRCVALPDNCFDTYEDRVEVVDEINRQYGKLVGTYEALKDNTRPGTPIYVLGYPYIAKDSGYCGTGLLKLSGDEIEFSKQIIDYLNEIERKAATTAGVYYVDISQAFAGRRLCETRTQDAAVNEMTIRSISASFHPNILGHKLLANEIYKKTDGFTVANTRADEDKPIERYDDLVILDKRTKSGRPIYDLYFAPELKTGDVIYVDQHVRRIVQGSLYGLAPNSPYTLELHSTPRVLGEFTSDENGDVSLAYDIPSNVEEGFHELHLKGMGEEGELVDLYSSVYIAKSLVNFSATPADDGENLPRGLNVDAPAVSAVPALASSNPRSDSKQLWIDHGDESRFITMLLVCCTIVVVITIILIGVRRHDKWR